MSVVKSSIVPGDKVLFFFTGREELIKGTVLAVPRQTGDCWRIRGEDGALRYVQTFGHILVLNEDGK